MPGAERVDHPHCVSGQITIVTLSGLREMLFDTPLEGRSKFYRGGNNESNR